MTDWKKILTQTLTPSLVLGFMRGKGILPKCLADLDGVPQDHKHHPEGWSCRESPVFPTQSGNTCPTKSVWTDNWLSLREFLPSTSARRTAMPSSHGTCGAQPIVAFPDPTIFPAVRTGVDSTSPTAELSKAVITEAVPLVLDAAKIGSLAIKARKVVRVVAVVKNRCVLPIMFGPIDHFQVFERVIKFVSIYVMDMLGAGKPFSQMKFHDEAVQTNPSALFGLRCGDCDVEVLPFSPIEANFVNGSIDGRVTLAFDLVIRHVNAHNSDPLASNTPEISVVDVTVGDALEHTFQVLDSTSDILRRAGVHGDRRYKIMLAAMLHDVGKAASTRWREDKLKWTAYGHEISGVPIAREFLVSIGYDGPVEEILSLVRNHMLHLRPSYSSKAVKKALNGLGPASFDDLLLLMEGDGMGRGTASSGLSLAVLEELIPLAKQNGWVPLEAGVST